MEKDSKMISFLAWIVEHAPLLGWLMLCAGVGGWFTPRFARRYHHNIDVFTWVGAFIGLGVGALTYTLGMLETPLQRIEGGLVLLAVLSVYWFGILPRLPRRPHQANWLMDHSLRRYRFDSFFGQFLSHILLLGWSLLVLAPFWTMLINSLKPKREIFRAPFDFPSAEIRTFDGYKSAWIDGNFDIYFRNSLLVTVNSILLILILGTLAAYALSSWRSRKATLVYLYFVAGLIIPIRLGTINIVTIIQDLGLNGKLEGLVLIYTAMGLPISVFVLTTFMRGIPQDLIDAAQIDGASEFYILRRIIVPLVRPALATIVIFNVIPIYNDLWFPLILTRAENVRTVTYGVSLLFGQYQNDWNAILSTLSLASMPVLIIYLLMSKQFIKGLTAGALKG
jgi:raffinose/stachyose/melibiose transport system permease protein